MVIHWGLKGFSINVQEKYWIVMIATRSQPLHNLNEKDLLYQEGPLYFNDGPSIFEFFKIFRKPSSIVFLHIPCLCSKHLIIFLKTDEVMLSQTLPFLCLHETRMNATRRNSCWEASPTHVSSWMFRRHGTLMSRHDVMAMDFEPLKSREFNIKCQSNHWNHGENGKRIIEDKRQGQIQQGSSKRRQISMTQHLLRKAVRRTDSLLFATEGRIGGLGGERRFWARNLAVPLAGGCANGVVFRAMYRIAICWRWGIDSPLVRREGSVWRIVGRLIGVGLVQVG